MIKDPFGPDWKKDEFHDILRPQLWRSPEVFESIIIEIKVAIDQIQSKLMLDDNGKASPALSRNVKLAPARRHVSQGRLSALVRELSRSTYQALSCAFKCQGPHNVSLWLAPSLTEVTCIPQDTDDYILQKLSLQFAISSHSNQDEAAKHWEEILLLPVIKPEMVIPTTLELRPAKKGVKFAETTPNTAEALGKSLKLNPDLATSLQRNIDDLCKVVHRSAKMKFEACYGCITDSVSLKTYGLYSVSGCPQDASDYNWKLIPLTDVLGSTGKELPVLTYADTLRLAWVVSSSVSKLHNTPWMPKTLSHSDVFFIRRPGKNLFEDVFVLKELPDDPLSPGEAAVANVRNKTLIALGILLVEIILRQTMDSRRGHEESLIPHANYRQAVHLLDSCEVKMEASDRYEEAVRRCLKGEFQSQGRNAEGDGFRQDVFGSIVNLLEEDMNDFNGNFV
ncbi:hypothetical protein CPLU01_07353 [Colletotrichum plurivorum]|uniref:DUF7580 domain-containing protein n=1 Tax=Colletotrichum plurivorum TaxID=2175906 RepID=A0A8H6KF18_9PEZI|nr:hypothetical protein CPLU01_07353 [Colletotrichum plurivorum]